MGTVDTADEQISPAEQKAEEAKVEAKDDKRKSKKMSVTKSPEESKFAGNGVTFRAKLFGTADVLQARGDEMCQKAMTLLKTAVKSTGEHKQKILLRVTLKGIILVDATTMLTLYEHAVNRISFIAKDVTDSRAFGYVVGSPDGKHVFYGIRSEKAAEAVVLTLRDLFQAVFELKKKESGAPADTATPAAAPAVEQQQQPAATTASTTQPAIGEAEPAKESVVEKKDSSDNLLSLLDDLSVMEPAPQNTPFSPQSTAAASPWGAQTSSSALPNTAWSGAAPVQNDPFTVNLGQQQQSPFGQPAPGTMQQQQPAFTQQQPAFGQQQPAFGQQQPAFGQQQPAFGQQQPAFGQQQPAFGQQQPFNNAQIGAGQQQPAFGAPQQQMFAQQQQPPQNQVQSPFQQQPFAQQPQQQAAPTNPMFSNDPFNTSGYAQQSQAPPVQPAAAPTTANPFAAGADPFGTVLQPQSVPQQNQQNAAQLGGTSLFSDLNPLGDSQSRKKEEFFSDVKNPPKPKLNELVTQPQPTAAPQPANNNSNISTSTHTMTSNVQSDPFADDPFFASAGGGDNIYFKSTESQAPSLPTANQSGSADDLFSLAPPTGPAPSLPPNVTIETAPAPPPRPQSSGGLISPPPAVKARQGAPQGPAPTPRPRQTVNASPPDPFSTSSGD